LLSVRAEWTRGLFALGAGGYLLKTTVSVYVGPEGRLCIEGFPKRERFNSAFFAQKILPSMIGIISVVQPKIRAQGDWLHIDHAKLHQACLSLQKTEQAWFARLSSCPISMI
jgi:hypothetical protein